MKRWLVAAAVFAAVYALLFYLGQPNQALDLVLAPLGMGGAAATEPLNALLFPLVRVALVALVPSAGFYFFFRRFAGKGALALTVPAAVAALDAVAYSFFVLFLPGAAGSAGGAVFGLLYFAALAVAYYGAFYVAEARGLLRERAWLRPLAWWAGAAALYKVGAFLFFDDFYLAQNWVSPMYRLMPLAGFGLAYLALGWAEGFFGRRWLASPWAPVAFFYAGVAAFYLAVWFFNYPTLAQVQAQGGQFVICWDREACTALREHWQATAPTGPRAAVNFSQEMGSSAFLPFLVSAMAAWAARALEREGKKTAK